MKPLPPAGSPHRRDTPPSLLSPFSRSAFPAAADGDHDAAVSEQPSVMLLEWWLATVEGDEQKIAVAGTFRWKQILHELYPAPIAKRHSVNILESEDGTVLLISGSLNVSRSLDNGYSNVVCKHFFVGFPHWWQSCNLRYPKRTNSDTGCQPCSSNTSKHPEGLKSSSRNESVFRKSSHLSNGTPRFEEHTCDGDIATSENAAASSEAGKDRKKTPVACLKNQGSWGENQHVASNKKPVGRPKKQISPHEKCRSATKSPGTKSPDSFGENQHVASNKKPVGRPKKQISPHEKCRSATKSPGTKSPDSFGENQHVASNKKVVFDQEMPASACSDVQVLIVQLFIHDGMFIFSVYQPIILFLFVLLFYVYAYR